jgi:hypothetical protein
MSLNSCIGNSDILPFFRGIIDMIPQNIPECSTAFKFSGQNNKIIGIGKERQKTDTKANLEIKF